MVEGFLVFFRIIEEQMCIKLNPITSKLTNVIWLFFVLLYIEPCKINHEFPYHLLPLILNHARANMSFQFDYYLFLPSIIRLIFSSIIREKVMWKQSLYASLIFYNEIHYLVYVDFMYKSWFIHIIIIYMTLEKVLIM